MQFGPQIVREKNESNNTVSWRQISQEGLWTADEQSLCAAVTNDSGT